MKKYLISALVILVTLAVSPFISAVIMQTEAFDKVTYLDADGNSFKASYRDFVVCAVCSAMPEEYEDEALKAQAVCTVSYIAYLKSQCMFITTENIEIDTAFSETEYGKRVGEIFDSVKNCRVTFEQKPAMTLTHSLNDGETDSLEGYPYLTEVASPGDLLSSDIPNNGEYIGMSRYGANYMAKQGATYKEILTRYFPGTKLNFNNKIE